MTDRMTMMDWSQKSLLLFTLNFNSSLAGIASAKSHLDR